MTCNKQASLSTRELQQKIDLFWSQTEKKKKSFLVSKCLKKNRNFKKKKSCEIFRFKNCERDN